MKSATSSMPTVDTDTRYAKGPTRSLVPISEVLRLNIGSRKTRILGYHNMDVRVGQDVDVLGDMADLKCFASNSLEEIRASNCLEHAPLPTQIEVLREWHRVLEPGGKLWLSVPDFECVVKIYNKTGMLEDWLIYHMYGEQGYEYQYHYLIYTYPNLRAILHEAGFSTVERLELLPGGLDDASSLRDNRTGQLVAINVCAIK